jgi:hypothetical protein
MKHSLLFILFFGLPALGQNSLSVPAAKGNAFNPDISANFLGLYERGTGVSDDRTQSPHNGFALQEAELQMLSDVDPYLRASVLLSISQQKNSADYGIDPEEVFLETTSLPYVTIRGGKFKMALGKHNQLHTHAFPFIDAPLINQLVLGDEGLNESGVSANVLLPVDWYSEVTAQAFSLTNEDLYGSGNSGNVGGLLHLKNLFDLTDDLTMEIGLSGTMGKNSFAQTSSVLGADLTFKWRPAVGGKYHALIWQTEYLNADRPGEIDATTHLSQAIVSGAASWLQYQFAERWWVQARQEYVGLTKSVGVPSENKTSFLLGFFPSEFSGFRVQYDFENLQGRGKTDQTFALQYNISIGAHPAHAY